MAIPANQSRRDVIRQVTEAVQRYDWVEVVELMKRGYLSDIPQKLRRWVLDETINLCHDPRCLGLLVEHCDDDLKDIILSNMVTRGHMWPMVGDVLRRGISDAQCRWAIGEACKHASEEEVITYILPNCADNQLDSALTPLVERRLWKAVRTVLRRGVSDSQYRWTIDEACKLAPDEDTITRYILPHCADNQLDSVLTLLVEKGLWKAVGMMLQRGITMSKHKWAIEEACKHASEKTIIDYILSHCADNQIDSALKQMVDRGLWKAVGIVLQRGVTLSKRKWAIDEACKHAPDDKFTDYMVPHCDDSQLDFVLTSLVERGLWGSVGMVLERSVSYQQHGGWANDEAYKRASEQDITFDMLRRRTDSHLDSVLTPLVERGLWWSVGTVLQRGVSDSQHRWAIDEACKQASDEEISGYIILHCADDQLDSVLTPLVERGLWSSVGTVLKRGVCDLQHRWAIDKACKHAPDEDITYYILPHCADNQLDYVLATVVERGLWKAVRTVLNRGVNHSQRRWAIDEACKHASEEEITAYMLPHCAHNQLDSVLASLVKRGLWKAVGTVLNRGVSHSQHRWATEEACKHAPEKECTRYILPHCAHNHMYSVLELLVLRVLWDLSGTVSQHRWAIDEACKHASDEEITDYILPHCADNQLDSVLASLVERGRCSSVGTVLHRDVNHSHHRWAIDEACKHASHAEIINYILPLAADNQLDPVLVPLVEMGPWEAVLTVLERGACSDSQCRWAIGEACNSGNNADVEFCLQPFLGRDRLPQFIYDGANYFLTQLIKRGLWKSAATLLCGVVIETLCRWAVVEDNTEPDDAAFWNMVRNPWYGVRDLCKLCQIVRRQPILLQYHRKLYHELYEILVDSVVESVFETWCTTEERKKEYTSTTGPSELVLRLHSEISPHVCSSTPGSKDRDSFLSKLLPCLRPLCDEFSETTKYGDRKHPFFAVHFIKSLVKHYYARRTYTASTEDILVILATVPVVPDVQSVALRFMLHHKRWDVISHACLSHVWEQVRRQLFQAAVEQREWSAVKRWADHSLYDDQRGWALEEAFQEKQWDVFLLLADYGLVESELMCVHYRLAKHADWDTVLQLFERGGDVTDVKELLTGAKSRKAAYDKDDALKRQQRAFELGGLENDFNARKTALKTLKRAAKQGDWSVVLFSLQQRPVEHHIHLALKAAVANGVWHVVRQLIKLGIDAAQRDSLFTRMVKQRQWGVCMVLLEQGVSLELCRTALPELMDMAQWTLVARVMIYDVDDAVRRRVMQRAMERKQGTVVWQCVITMHGDRLSVEERKELFQEALSREVLQAIKPLIEVKDATGIQHRDTVLPEAAEQHQWDVVDHCQLHHADIDMKDAEGHTPIHRAARKEDWEAVKALTKRGADPSLLDCWGESVLHRAIAAEQWDTVKLLIQYHGDIHQANNEGETPLQMLIDARQGEIIEHTLMWCPDQWTGVNTRGETALHVVCVSGCPSALYYLVARGVDPQDVTKRGHSALSYAVLCKECPQKMVAECIKLGFCAYQPHITDAKHISADFICNGKLRLSPVLLAVTRGLPVVTQMLYESGSCSYTESFKLRKYLPRNHAQNLRKTGKADVLGYIYSNYSRSGSHSKKRERNSVEASVRYLRKVCSTPRSLKSSCRLVISRCVTVQRQRRRDATYARLPLTEELRNYVMFSDLTDPDYGQDETEGDEEDSDDDNRPVQKGWCAQPL